MLGTDEPPLAQDARTNRLREPAAACARCDALQRDPEAGLAVVDMACALQDFDGNAVAVNGLLHAFVSDGPGCLRTLAGLGHASRLQAWAVVHDVANTLDAGWCRWSAMAVRRLEERLRRDHASPVADIVTEVEAVVRRTFDGVREQLEQCAPCPLVAATA